MATELETYKEMYRILRDAIGDALCDQEHGRLDIMGARLRLARLEARELRLRWEDPQRPLWTARLLPVPEEELRLL